MTTITLNLPETTQQVIARACSLADMSLDDFIIKQAYNNALTMLEQKSTWVANEDDMRAIITEISTPTLPNDAMKALLALGERLD